jgi:catechol 2,3-dioxygenase-like lactoylglutathione lyase family enzyme
MSRIRPSKFAHVVYRTRRYDEMIDWYIKVFDAHVQSRDDALAFLSYDDEHHRFAFANLGELKPTGNEAAADDRGMIGVDHVAYTYASIDELFDQYAYLKNAGVTPYWCIHHGPTISMYYADPDGNQMEFQVDCFESSEQSNDFMTGPHFAANPVGVEFDPEAWLREREAGTPLSSRLERKEHMPISPLRGALG